MIKAIVTTIAEAIGWLIQPIALLMRAVLWAHDFIPGIPVLQDWARSWLLDLYMGLYDLSFAITDVAREVFNLGDELEKLLSWDAILDRLYLYFPFLRDIVGQIQDTIRGFVDMTFPWVYDPELTIRGFMDRWLDIYFPWLRDPELTIWGWLEWRVKELIPDLPDLGAIVAERVREWIEEHLMAWLENRAVDIARMAGRVLERIW